MTHALSRVVPHTRRMVAVVTVTVLVVVAAIGSGLYWYFGPHQEGTHFSAIFTQSIGIYPGSDVRILGVAVGSVDSVTPEGTDVRIDMHLDRGIDVLADTRAVIMSPSLVSDRYVQLTGVYPGKGATLASGATIPLDHTATTVEIDQLTQSVVNLTKALGPNGANKNGALSDLLNVGAANLGGNGALIHQTIAQLGKATGTLANSKQDFFKTIDNLSDFTKTLANNDRSVRGLNSSLSSVSQVLAQDRESFTAALHDLTQALTTVKGFIDRNRQLISSNVHKLSVITETLMKERDSIQQALQTAPLALDNVINAYDPQTQTLVGRGDLNELSIWPNNSSDSTKPMLVPSADDPSGSTGGN